MSFLLATSAVSEEVGQTRIGIGVIPGVHGIGVIRDLAVMVRTDTYLASILFIRIYLYAQYNVTFIVSSLF